MPASRIATPTPTRTRVGTLAAALLCALAVLLAASGPARAADPPAGIEKQCAADAKAGKPVSNWCRVVAETKVTTECADGAPADPAEKFSEACKKNYKKLHARCDVTGMWAEWDDWGCRQFRSAWAGKRTPTGETRPVDTGGGDPATTTPPATTGDEGYPAKDTGVGSDISGQSDFCKTHKDLDAQSRQSCENAQSIAHPYPLMSYGLDNGIHAKATSFWLAIPQAFNDTIGLVWAAILFALNGVLLILDWAFSFDLVNKGMAGVAQGLYRLSTDVLGAWWIDLGIAVAALGGIWNGLVRRQTTQTIAGLASTVLLMVIGMLIIHQPHSTVGTWSKQANEASLGVWSVAATGTVKDPPNAFAGANRQLFDSLVLRPWCALQFGEVNYCFQKVKDAYGHDQACRLEEKDWAPDKEHCDVPGATVADAWLQYPAGSAQRRQLFVWLNEHRKERAQMMGGSGNLATRAGLLLMVGVGEVGAIGLLGGLSAALIFAAIEALLLLLLMAAMVIAPCFGEKGRAGFVLYLVRLGSAVFRKFVYAVYLAVVMLVANIIATLPNMTFGTNWLLLIVFWWGVMLKRKEMLAFTQGQGGRSSGGGALSLAKMYMGYRGAREAGRMVTALPRRAVGATRAMANVTSRRRRARGAAVADHAKARLGEHARRDIAARKRAELDAAGTTARQAGANRRRLGRLDDRRSTVRDGLTTAQRAARDAGAQLQQARSELGSLDRELDGLRGQRERVDYDEQTTWAEAAAVARERASLDPSDAKRRAQLDAKDEGLLARQQAIDARKTDLDGRIDRLQAARPALAGRVGDAGTVKRTAEDRVESLGLELGSIDAERQQLLASLNDPEVRNAESLVARQGGRPVEVTEAEVRDHIGTLRNAINSDPRDDTRAQAHVRELLRRVDQGEGLSGPQLRDAMRDIRRVRHEAEEVGFKAAARRREIKRAQSRRGMRR